MGEPDSFCFICTGNSSYELIGMLLSLSIYHRNAVVYGLIDSYTENILTNVNPTLRLKLVLKVCLDKYSNKNRNMMLRENIWNEFQMQKAEVIKYALETSCDTLFLDSDILFLNPLNVIDKSKEINISPHYVRKSNTDEVGYYNGGCLWTKNRNVPDDWIEFTKTSRYHDQASIEDLANKYSYYEFGEEINFMPWRIKLADDAQGVINNININNENINYKTKPIIFIHTHFTRPDFFEVNNIFINALKKLKRYKELMIIDRIINKQWTIQIPHQPLPGIWGHNNDSFRELALLYKKNNKDVNIELVNNGHCWLNHTIILYDRPTKIWFNHDVYNAALLLLGNGDINVEGKLLDNVLPWIFWPRRPFILEKFIFDNKRKSFNERLIDSIFIGNIENEVQNKFRNTGERWLDVLTEYHCTAGNKHKFTQNEYLEKISQAKYGLCLRGFGTKCHREIELMALGTVPIITPDVCIKSYMDPPRENEHYIAVKNPEELKDKLTQITEEQWEAMSKNCYEWYERNIHSKNSFNNFLSYIFYK